MSEKQKRVKYDTLVVEGVTYKTFLTTKYKARKPYKEDDLRFINAFISGTIVDVFVKKGREVEEGEPLLTLEAMKMKNEIQAPIAGVVKNVNVEKGALVSKNQLLIEFE